VFDAPDLPLLQNADIDSVALEISAQRAALDLQRIAALLAQRHLRLGRRMPGQRIPTPTWRLLLDIEEQAFADLGFQGRYPAAVRWSFARLADSRFAGPDLDAPVDWQRDDNPIPAVYAIVRGLIQAISADTSS
jgi:hypothetical protein